MSPTTTVEAFAPAKINLTLHVTGQRPDGYHLLDSLVVFADVGDTISAEDAPDTSLAVDGPRRAGVPVDDGNLVLKAARLMPGANAALTLTKRLPAASGIGGGSADAAATLRALHALTGAPLPDGRDVLALGADVPVCLEGRAVRMSGIGERLAPVPPLPPLPAVLANPGIEVPTPSVFKALARRDNAPMPDIPQFTTPGEIAEWLATQRNDLEPPARKLAPQITETLTALSALPGCQLARMSGSGATCFALFSTPEEAESAARSLRQNHPDWWTAATRLS
ncbi:4-diphosphocytidyl-2-C-methyl-D-erythritol kinase [Aliiruegeria haliotis]|uniref:4-diphosphocytidyl-2-C-methyl-D-erythritol kinase n=1 Tax=Aliiruegeria haliotis TaxID=1280846 RepID=A0A2T0RT45_9RHOB|nr:4-(cytidine 5'-diphospho)-2-C-methyl-D-erythritol kinase [Aliiruegeria haliotis]PRY24354.1 4-diphosphocytidyl-2-C-methyl-D-erythritol kinase [Aliiruegeria haliotis]